MVTYTLGVVTEHFTRFGREGKGGHRIQEDGGQRQREWVFCPNMRFVAFSGAHWLHTSVGAVDEHYPRTRGIYYEKWVFRTLRCYRLRPVAH